jgi:epoxyqueuosine reductase
VDDFAPRHNLDNEDLLTLFNWDETEFLAKTLGSAIRRIDYLRFIRNVLIGLGNAPSDPAIIQALQRRRGQICSQLNEDTAWLDEHFDWALNQQLKIDYRRKRKIKRAQPDS